MKVIDSQKANYFLKWFYFSFLAWLFILICFNVTAVKSQENHPMVLLSEVVFSGKVVSVISGDTIEVDSKGRTQKVRLESIDAPENGQAYSEVAREFLSKLVLGESVTVYSRIYDWSGKSISLGYVIMGEKDLSEEMIKAGLAWYCDQSLSSKEFRTLESEARLAKKGLWQEPNPKSPWQFRGKKECFEESEL